MIGDQPGDLLTRRPVIVCRFVSQPALTAVSALMVFILDARGGRNAGTIGTEVEDQRVYVLDRSEATLAA